MFKLGCAAWSLPASCESGSLPDNMVMHVGVQTWAQMRQLKACPVNDERALRDCLGGYDERQKISAIGLNLVEASGLEINPGFRTALFENAVHVVKCAAFLEVSAVYIPSFNQSEIRSARSLAASAIFFKQLCRAVQGLPVLIASENSLSARHQMSLVEQVNESNFRVLLDVFNPLRWGHSVEEIISSIPVHLLDQVHIKDGVLPGYGNALLGHGEGNLAGIIEQIKRYGFCDTYILENDYSLLSLAGLHADVEFLRSHLSSTPGQFKRGMIDA